MSNETLASLSAYAPFFALGLIFVLTLASGLRFKRRWLLLIALISGLALALAYYLALGYSF